MTTIAAGNHQQIYFDHLDDIVITPGSGGTVKFDCSTPNSAATRPTARIIYSETSISIPAGSTVFLDAVGADATYTARLHRNFTGSLKKLGATAYDLTTHATVGVTALTRSLSGDFPRFSTATIKGECTATLSQLRFQGISATADPDDQLLTIDLYLPFHPDEFGSTRYPATTNPTIDIRLCNTTSGTADSWTFSFSAVYLRKGWNTLKMWAGDTVGGAGTGTLAVGASRTVGGAGISFLSPVQYCEITFNNINGKTVYVDQLRRGASLPIPPTSVVATIDVSRPLRAEAITTAVLRTSSLPIETVTWSCS